MQDTGGSTDTCPSLANTENSFADSLAGARRAASSTASKPVPKSNSFASKAAQSNTSISDGNAFASAKSRANDRVKVESRRKVDEKAKAALADRYADILQHDESSRSRPETVQLRNDDLTLAVRLPLGPIHHRPPPADPLFDYLEPTSGVRLLSRSITHEDLQDHLAERYLVRSPGELYGAARRVRGRNEWEVPVTGDWVVFGVLAERSGIRYTNPTAAKPAEEGDEDEEAYLKAENGAGKKAPVKDKEPASKRYLVFKLLDLGTRAGSSSSSSSYINVLLFESSTTSSDHVDSSTSLRTKTYAGGSGGAYESLWKEQGGALVAILNPRILPPRSNGPHASDGDVLAISPESAQSVLVVGRAKDLGSCRALRRDTGKECGGWVDLRTSGGGGEAVCEWHVKNQVKKVRAGRAELFSGTGGMQSHTGTKFGAKAMKGKGGGQGAGYDPVNKTGLLPDRPATTSINGSVVRVVGGSAAPAVYKTSTSHTRFTANDSKRSLLGRPGFADGPPLSRRYDEAQDREKRSAELLQRKRKQEEREMEKMLAGDREKGGSMGGRYLEEAKRMREAQKKKALEKAAAKTKGKKKVVEAKKAEQARAREGDESTGNSADDESGGSREGSAVARQPKRKRPFSAAAVRAIGFDPTLSSLHHRDDPEDDEAQGGKGNVGEIKAKREAAVKLLEGPGERKVNLEFPTEAEGRRRSGVDVNLGKSGKRNTVGPGIRIMPVVKAVNEDEEEEESDDDLVIEPKPMVCLHKPLAVTSS